MLIETQHRYVYAAEGTLTLFVCTGTNYIANIDLRSACMRNWPEKSHDQMAHMEVCTHTEVTTQLLNAGTKTITQSWQTNAE